ncbi:hypothetical protein FCULG_00012761 [Fusarium culmorum]|uniref:RING-type domain-containing protein n=1 Tax=Fusarium culmorum TaxID=5516 RepID=A0A2T4GC81_FUSCU|nr:hypothetical protein FCULG_00012761 [Fusarium culmorum]
MAGQNHVMSPFHQIVADSTRTEEVVLPGRNEVDELICSICLSPMLTPLLTTCGHTFCSECLHRHFTVTNQYPLDRRSIRPRKARRPQSMVDALDRLIVMCPNANQGCSSSINRDQVVTHILRCAYIARVSKDITPDKDIEFNEFVSWVQMSLYYPKLDEHKTLWVFELNLDIIRDRFKQQGREIRYDASSIEEFARQHYIKHKFGRWNGRQIRNLCQTALALAEFDAQGEDL